MKSNDDSINMSRSSSMSSMTELPLDDDDNDETTTTTATSSKPPTPTSSSSEQQQEQQFEHNLQVGDHVIRWSHVGYMWPIQIHGIVIETGGGGGGGNSSSNLGSAVTIVDFGLTSANPAGKEEEVLEKAENEHRGRLAGVLKKKKFGGGSSSGSGGGENGGGTGRSRRLNVIVLTEKKEIKKWKKVNYGESFGGNGGGGKFGKLTSWLDPSKLKKKSTQNSNSARSAFDEDENGGALFPVSIPDEDYALSLLPSDLTADMDDNNLPSMDHPTATPPTNTNTTEQQQQQQPAPPPSRRDAWSDNLSPAIYSSIRRLRLSLSSKTECTSSLHDIRLLTRSNPPDASTVAIDSGAARAVVGAMMIHSSCISVQMEGCAVICNLACTEDGRKKLGEAGGVEVVLEAIRGFGKDDKEVAMAGFAAVCNLAVEESVRLELRRKGAVVVIRGVMGGWMDDVGLLYQGRRALTALQEEDVDDLHATEHFKDLKTDTVQKDEQEEEEVVKVVEDIEKTETNDHAEKSSLAKPKPATQRRQSFTKILSLTGLNTANKFVSTKSLLRHRLLNPIRLTKSSNQPHDDAATTATSETMNLFPIELPAAQSSSSSPSASTQNESPDFFNNVFSGEEKKDEESSQQQQQQQQQSTHSHHKQTSSSQQKSLEQLIAQANQLDLKQRNKHSTDLKSDLSKQPFPKHSSSSTSTNKPTPPPKLPKSDPLKLVLARVNFLLEHEHEKDNVLPPYHIFISNSECIAVWCMTGRWTTLQSAVFLHSTAVGNAKQTILAMGGVAAMNPFLIPVAVGVGVAYIGAPWLYLDKCKKEWEKITGVLNDLFWAWAGNEVFVECIEKWSGLA